MKLGDLYFDGVFTAPNMKGCSWAVDGEPHEAHEWSAHAHIAGELIYATYRCPGFETYLALVPNSLRDYFMSIRVIDPYKITVITNGL